MHHHYSDITALTEAPPKWYDENGVPRYCDFHPNKLANIYANEAVLASIECQICKTEFRVAFSELNQRYKLWNEIEKKRTAFISDLIVGQTLSYGDPPNTNCCAGGPSTTSIPIAVIEYWVKPFIRGEMGKPITDTSLLNWSREREFELPLSGEDL